MKTRLHKRICQAILIVLFGLTVSPYAALAHAYVVSSSPSADETLVEPPDSVTIEFNEPIEEGFHTLTVTGPGGERADAGDAEIDPKRPTRLRVELLPDLQDGVYTATWNAVSGDGHPVSGTLSFLLGQGAAASVPHEAGDQATPFPGLSLLAVRWLFYGGMAFYLGTILFHLGLLPRGTRPVHGRLERRSRFALLAGYAATAGGVLLSLPQQTAGDARGGWEKAWNLQLMQQTLEFTSFGEAWKAQAVLLAVLLGLTLLLLRREKPKETKLSGQGPFIGRYRSLPGTLYLSAAFLCGLGLLLCKATIGHAAAASPKVAAIAADFLHLASSLIWLGGVGALVFLLPAAVNTDTKKGDVPHAAYWRTVRRFSVTAAVCVAILLASGIYGSLLHIPTWYSLMHTDYGLVLLAKIGLTLISLALGLAAFLRSRSAPPGPPLGAGLWAELGAGLAVLVLAAVLANLPTAAATPGPLHLTHPLPDGSRIEINIAPNAVGINSFDASVIGPDGQPRRDIEQITLTLTSLEMDMGKIEITLPGGTPLPAEELVPMSGRWKAHVHVLLKSLDTWDYDFKINVGG